MPSPCSLTVRLQGDGTQSVYSLSSQKWIQLLLQHEGIFFCQGGVRKMRAFLAGRTDSWLSYPTLPDPTRSYPTLPYPIYPMLSYPTLPYPILSDPILAYPTLPYPIQSYPTLSYHTVPYRTLSYRTLPYPTLCYPIVEVHDLMRI